MANARLPTFFIPHGGGPCFFMDWNPPDAWDCMRAFLAGLAGTLSERPRAILVISAHWEEPRFTINRAESPSLLYDYYGFPEHTYSLQYPAVGAPALANRVGGLIASAGYEVGFDDMRGLDHGVFVPFKVMYPEAEIPIVQLSLLRGLDPTEHLRVGAALTPLRDEGVLIVGSGMSYHNLRTFGPAGTDISYTFDDWLTRTVESPDPAQREAALIAWEQAPAARQAHPREEHLLPLMIAAGAAGKDTGRCIYADDVMGLRISGFRFG